MAGSPSRHVARTAWTTHKDRIKSPRRPTESSWRAVHSNMHTQPSSRAHCSMPSASEQSTLLGICFLLVALCGCGARVGGLCSEAAACEYIDDDDEAECRDDI